MTMYCIAGLSMMHMLLHVESECDIHVITRGRMWRNNAVMTFVRTQYFADFQMDKSSFTVVSRSLKCRSQVLLYNSTVVTSVLNLKTGLKYFATTPVKSKVK